MKHDVVLKGFWVLLSIVFMISIVVFFTHQKPSIDPPNNDYDEPPIVTPVVMMESLDYTVYRLEEISFPFVIATLQVSSTEPFKLSLSDLVTSEQLRLDQISVYWEDLKAFGLDLTIQNVVESLDQLTNMHTFTVLIPIRNNELPKLSLYINLNSDIKIDFDVQVGTGSKEMLGWVQPIDPITPIEESIKVLTVIDVTSKAVFERIDEIQSVLVEFPSTVSLIGVLLEATFEDEKSVIIEEARYRLVDLNQVAISFPSTYEVEGYTNMINTDIVNNTKSYIFFDVYSISEATQQKAIFEFRFKNSDEWHRIQLNH